MEDIINGVFLLLCLILANYTAPTFGKRINNLINKKYYIRLIIIYILILFTINFTASDNIHIKEHLSNTNILFILYIMFTKLDIYLSLLVFLLILIYYIINSHIAYLKTQNKKQEIENKKNYSSYTKLLIIVLIVVGFIYKIHNKSQKLKYIFSDN